MNRIRQEKAKEYIESRNVVTIKELQNLFPEVSLITIHRDLDVLEKEGAVVKFRGGVRSARYTGDPEFNMHFSGNHAGKQIIAHKALELIRPYASVFMDASTTNLELAKALPDMNVNIFTTGPGVALELCRLNNPSVTVCCGKLDRKNLAVSGQNTLEMLEKINIDIAFVDASGCSVDTGFTCETESDMLVKKLVIEKARTSVIMCGKEKLKCLRPYTFAEFGDVDYLITDSVLPDDFVQAVEKAGVKIL